MIPPLWEKAKSNKEALDEIEREEWKRWLKTQHSGTSLVVQWWRLQAPNAGGLGLIPGQATRSPMLQLRPDAAK